MTLDDLAAHVLRQNGTIFDGRLFFRGEVFLYVGDACEGEREQRVVGRFITAGSPAQGGTTALSPPLTMPNERMGWLPHNRHISETGSDSM